MNNFRKGFAFLCVVSGIVTLVLDFSDAEFLNEVINERGAYLISLQFGAFPFHIGYLVFGAPILLIFSGLFQFIGRKWSDQLFFLYFTLIVYWLFWNILFLKHVEFLNIFSSRTIAVVNVILALMGTTFLVIMRGLERRIGSKPLA